MMRLTKGSVVHIEGIPVKLAQDCEIEVCGGWENLAALLKKFKTKRSYSLMTSNPQPQYRRSPRQRSSR